MSQIAHRQSPAVALRLRRSHRRVLWLATLAAGLVVAALMAIAILDDDNSSTSTVQPSPVSSQADGIRYDGGPEEGSALINRSQSAAGIRYDGGPEEGSATVSRSSSAATTRYDGGPEEGSRVAPQKSSDVVTRPDGVVPKYGSHQQSTFGARP